MILILFMFVIVDFADIGIAIIDHGKQQTQPQCQQEAVYNRRGQV